MKRLAQYILFVAFCYLCNFLATLVLQAIVVHFPSASSRGAFLGMDAALNALSYGLLMLLFRSRIRVYGSNFDSLQEDPVAYRRVIAAIGETPLFTFLIFVVSILLQQFAKHALLLRAFGIDAFSALILVLFSGSLACLIGSFVYIYLDDLTSKFLLSQKLVRYPADLRENRQQKKIIIIPIIMSFMASLFSFTVMAFLAPRLSGSQAAATAAFMGKASLAFLPFTLAYHAIVVTMVIIWAGNTAKLYRYVIERLDQVSSAEKDLTGRVFVASVDEIASIAGLINQFQDTLQRSFIDVCAVSTEFGSVQRDLFTAISSSARNSDQIGAAVDTMVEVIKREDASVSSALESGKRLRENAAKVIQSVHAQNEAVTESSRRASESLEALSHAARSAQEISGRTEELIGAFRAGGESLSATVSSVNSIVELSRKLEGINTLIAKIANQTNLLAMNAAIEAAHAGDAGRGFSVVADEIRKLAETTAQHTKDSRESLKAVLGQIQRALESSRATSSSFGTMNAMLEAVGRETRSISESMEAQDRSNTSVLEGLRSSLALVQRTAEASTALDTETSSMQTALSDLAEASRLAMLNTEMTRARNKEVQSSIERLQSLATKAKELADKEEGLIADFRI